MAAQCPVCGRQLGFLERLFGAKVCSACDRDAKEREHFLRREAIREYEQHLRARIRRTTPVEEFRTSNGVQLPADEMRFARMRLFREACERLLADGWEPKKETRLQQLRTILEIDEATWSDELTELASAFAVARIGAGQLPQVAPERLLLKRGEIAHLDVDADLMKERVIREYQGGHQGVSVPIGSGFRYYAGASRGQAVVVGSQLEIADSGRLTVTSARVVFAGMRSSMDMPLSKLIGLSVYDDGVSFNLSNRVKAPLFRVQHGPVVAAVVNEAAVRVLDPDSRNPRPQLN